MKLNKKASDIKLVSLYSIIYNDISPTSTHQHMVLYDDQG
jgi:hypothetical protein